MEKIIQSLLSACARSNNKSIKVGNTKRSLNREMVEVALEIHPINHVFIVVVFTMQIRD